jgi:hypothetical protein
MRYDFGDLCMDCVDTLASDLIFEGAKRPPSTVSPDRATTPAPVMT